MIRITVEMVPYGFENSKYKIGEMTIVNDGTGTIEYGNYDITIVSDNYEIERRVEKFPRDKGIWPLITEALK